jgi:hypothetical protein
MNRSVKVFVRIRPSKHPSKQLEIINENTIKIAKDQDASNSNNNHHGSRVDQLRRTSSFGGSAPSTPTGSRRRRRHTATTPTNTPPPTTQQRSSTRTITKDIVYQFEKIFGMDTTNDQVFQTVARPMIDMLFQGYNSSILAFGQSGSGKTYTMIGSHLITKNLADTGIVIRLIDEIIKHREIRKQQGWKCSLLMSNVQVYMEQVTDLFHPDQNTKKDLRIRETSNGDIYVEDAIWKPIETARDGIEWVNYGSQHRVVSATDMNSVSSRSHSIILMQLTQENVTTGEKLEATMYLVDLAGSERVAFTNAQGVELKQASAVNKSLSTLTNVINAITNSKTTHIPYRNSKLTRILQNTLGGNSLASIIITASPEDHYLPETTMSLRFGARALNMPNKPKINNLLTVKDYKRMLKEAQTTINEQQIVIKSLKTQLNNQKRSSIRNKPPSRFTESFNHDSQSSTSSEQSQSQTQTHETQPPQSVDGELIIDPNLEDEGDDEDDDDDANEFENVMVQTLQSEIQELQDRLIDKIRIINELHTQIQQLYQETDEQTRATRIGYRTTQTQNDDHDHTDDEKDQTRSHKTETQAKTETEADTENRLTNDDAMTSRTHSIILLTIGIVLFLTIAIIISFLPQTIVQSLTHTRAWLLFTTFWATLSGVIIGISI